MQVDAGTPAQKLNLVADTGSNNVPGRHYQFMTSVGVQSCETLYGQRRLKVSLQANAAVQLQDKAAKGAATSPILCRFPRRLCLNARLTLSLMEVSFAAALVPGFVREGAAVIGCATAAEATKLCPVCAPNNWCELRRAPGNRDVLFLPFDEELPRVLWHLLPRCKTGGGGAGFLGVGSTWELRRVGPTPGGHVSAHM